MVKPMKDKTGITVLIAFIQMVNKSNRKPNELWVDQVKNFNNLMQEWLDNNDIFFVHSTHNVDKSVIADFCRF